MAGGDCARLDWAARDAVAWFKNTKGARRMVGRAKPEEPRKGTGRRPAGAGGARDQPLPPASAGWLAGWQLPGRRRAWGPLGATFLRPGAGGPAARPAWRAAAAAAAARCKTGLWLRLWRGPRPAPSPGGGSGRRLPGWRGSPEGPVAVAG